MRIGRIEITRLKRDKLGRPLHPWEIVTLDQLSEPARLLITKMARVAARDFFEQQREEWLETMAAEMPHAIERLAEEERRKLRGERLAPVPRSYMDGRPPADTTKGSTP